MYPDHDHRHPGLSGGDQYEGRHQCEGRSIPPRWRQRRCGGFTPRGRCWTWTPPPAATTCRSPGALGTSRASLQQKNKIIRWPCGQGRKIWHSVSTSQSTDRRAPERVRLQRRWRQSLAVSTWTPGRCTARWRSTCTGRASIPKRQRTIRRNLRRRSRHSAGSRRSPSSTGTACRSSS